ncbi:MAG: guanylate kinase [Melioribacteraceae bacterium]|nr:guanylate kinase [Melioribacteraceae bacterium]MCF8353278.1 guanylate kinase [Melioribacteraceae bacterium]MCF8394836.1 guanylate kinase [Melioribacteraceae bacterium]MCF8418805.1 guanylate kinase [Melioribacteraceae bacterium]
MKRGKLFVFSAPSGSGKTTIVKDVLKNFPELIFSVSATTRKARKNEVNGKDYFFITEQEFLKKIEQKEFIEWEQFYDYYYGTLLEFVESTLEDGKSIVMELDVKGAVKIKQNYPDSILIFISPPNLKVLRERLINRKTDSETDLKKRIERAELELGYKDKFDHIVFNEDLQKAKKQVKELIKNKLD